MNIDTAHRSQTQRLTDPQWLVALEFGGSAPTSHHPSVEGSPPIWQEKPVHAHPGVPNRGALLRAQIDEMFDKHAEVHTIRERAAVLSEARGALRFGMGCFAACVGVPMLLAHAGASPPGIFGFIWIGILFMGLACIAFACSAIGEVYEVRIAPSGLVRFYRVIGSVDVQAADILRLVRYQAKSDGRVTPTFAVVHRRGRLLVHESILPRLTALTPQTGVATEIFDDTD